jgi:hypothetical protein
MKFLHLGRRATRTTCRHFTLTSRQIPPSHWLVRLVHRLKVALAYQALNHPVRTMTTPHKPLLPTTDAIDAFCAHFDHLFNRRAARQAIRHQRQTRSWLDSRRSHLAPCVAAAVPISPPK